MGTSPLSKRPRRGCKKISGCLTFGLVLSSLVLVWQAIKSRTICFLIPKDAEEIPFRRHSKASDTSIFDLPSFQDSRTASTLEIKSLMKNNASSDELHSQPADHPRVCLDTPLSDPIWEWHHFSNETNSNKRLLIAQYSAFGKYARLLELTSPINKAYAKMWKHDIVILQGTTMVLPWDKNCTPPEERSRFNKIGLLLMALSRSNYYDQLLILDADTLLYDFSADITQLLTDEHMLVAQRTHQTDPPATLNINNGVTLWNLQHPMTEAAAQDWDIACRDGIPDNRPYRGDQFYLRQILKPPDRVAAVWGVWEEFYYRDATIIKHFQRSNARSWNDTGLDAREERILNATNYVCHQFELDSDNLEYINYTAIESSQDLEGRADEQLSIAVNDTSPSGTFGGNSSNCTLKKKSTWDLQSFESNASSSAQKRLLIAQYAGYGSYSKLMELTAPINKAYARKWGHDILILQGEMLVLKMDGPCELPAERARFNKIPILIYAVSEKKEYDQVLILDADAMMYDLAFDVTQLLSEDDFLAGHRVNKWEDERSSNVNNGITLWNLHHSMTPKVGKQWFERALDGLKVPKDHAWKKPHGDQYYLQRALKRVENATNHVHALPFEFKYGNGTVAKHFVRQNRSLVWNDGGEMAERIKIIEKTVREVCETHPLECENLQEIPYTTF